MAVMVIGGISLRPPEKKISFETSRSVARFDIPGYKPIYQDMGQGECTCSFNGIIDGFGAYSKALALEKLKDKGEPVIFIAGPVTTKVVLESFKYEWYRDDVVRYEISLIRTEDSATSLTYTVSSLVKNRKAISNALSGGLASGLAAVATVTVPFVQGEDLRSLAQGVSGNVDDWQYIASLNNLDSAIVPDEVKSLLMPASIDAMQDLKAVVDTVNGGVPSL